MSAICARRDQVGNCMNVKQRYKPASGARDDRVGKNPGVQDIVEAGNRQAASPR